MAVRPGKKFGFQSAAENLQRRRRPDRLRCMLQPDETSKIGSEDSPFLKKSAYCHCTLDVQTHFGAFKHEGKSHSRVRNELESGRKKTHRKTVGLSSPNIYRFAKICYSVNGTFCGECAITWLLNEHPTTPITASLHYLVNLWIFRKKGSSERNIYYWLATERNSLWLRWFAQLCEHTFWYNEAGARSRESTDFHWTLAVCTWHACVCVV